MFSGFLLDIIVAACWIKALFSKDNATYKNEVVDEENAEEGPESINSPEFDEESFAEEDETENVTHFSMLKTLWIMKIMKKLLN